MIALANGENIFQAGYEIVDALLEGCAEAKAIKPAELVQNSVNWAYFEGTYCIPTMEK